MSTEMTPSIQEIEKVIDRPSTEWRNACHAVSLAVVRSGLLGEPGPTCRVVRGWTFGYGLIGQHSWIALGRPFELNTRIIDVTVHAWERVDGIVESTVGGAYEGAIDDGLGHIAHGYKPGDIWDYGRPSQTGDPVELDRAGLSDAAVAFLDTLGPLSIEGWRELVSFPHGGWPAHEICEAIAEQLKRVRVLLPIDVLAHATDRNPEELYW